MSTLAIDRFRQKGLPPEHEERAQRIAADLNREVLLGYLESSIAIALERPRWANRDRLAIDLRVADIVLSRPRR